MSYKISEDCVLVGLLYPNNENRAGCKGRGQSGNVKRGDTVFSRFIVLLHSGY